MRYYYIVTELKPDFEEYPGGFDPVESLLLHVAVRASERFEDLSSDDLFKGDKLAAEQLYAATECVKEDNPDSAREYFIDTGLVSELRLADALDISVDELRQRLQITS